MDADHGGGEFLASPEDGVDASRRGGTQEAVEEGCRSVESSDSEKGDSVIALDMRLWYVPQHFVQIYSSIRRWNCNP